MHAWTRPKWYILLSFDYSCHLCSKRTFLTQLFFSTLTEEGIIKLCIGVSLKLPGESFLFVSIFKELASLAFEVFEFLLLILNWLPEVFFIGLSYRIFYFFSADIFFCSLNVFLVFRTFVWLLFLLLVS